jgi:hypothetical protein
MKISSSEIFEFPITDTMKVIQLAKQYLDSPQGELRFIFITRQGYGAKESWQLEIKVNEQKTTS